MLLNDRRFLRTTSNSLHNGFSNKLDSSYAGKNKNVKLNSTVVLQDCWITALLKPGVHNYTEVKPRAQKILKILPLQYDDVIIR